MRASCFKGLESKTHLYSVGTMFNSRKRWGRVCLEQWPCKLMTCKRCVRIRRNFFLREGTRFSEIHELYYHVVVSWPLQECEDPWLKMHYCLPKLTKTLSGGIGKYIRSLGIGEREQTPHIHYLVNAEGFEKIRLKAKKYGPKETKIYPQESERAHDVERLLGYFFDHNFLPTYLDRGRPRRIRILSGSRGLSYGFPSYRS